MQKPAKRQHRYEPARGYLREHGDPAGALALWANGAAAQAVTETECETNRYIAEAAG